MRIAPSDDRRGAECGQGNVVEGALIPLETAGTSRAIVPAHRARSPRLGRASAVTLAAKTSPSSH